MDLLLRRVLFTAILCLIPSLGLAITPTVVQYSSGTANTGSTVSASFGGNVTAGNWVYACISVNSGGTIVAPTMTGESFSGTPVFSYSAGNPHLACYEIASAAGGNSTITETAATCSGCGWNMTIVEVNCVGACVDQTTGTNNATCTGGCSVSSSGSGSSGNLNLAWFADDSAQSTYTAGAGYTILNNALNTDGNSQGDEYGTAGSGGIQNATATSSNAGDTQTMGIDSIASMSGPPTVTTNAPFINSFTAITGSGTIANSGGYTVTGSSICWGTMASPCQNGGTFIDTGGTSGAFTASITGLASGVLYHVQGQAVNSAGTGYGSDVPFYTLQNARGLGYPGAKAGTARWAN